VRARVDDAVRRQERRYADRPWRRNAHVPAGALVRTIPLPSDAADAWRWVVEARRMTGRGAARIRRVARTLADLEGTDALGDAHVLAAAELRQDVP
jgi:magnesium chelatase family protein